MKRSLGLFVALGLTALAVSYYVLERGTRTIRSEQAVAAHADEVFRSPTSAVAGNPQGDVSVVAFFDYNCPYCRKDVPALAKLMDADPNLRLVLKELPVLGPDSEAAARLALAANRQGNYLALYRRLIASRSRVTEARALAVAAELGLDTDRLKRDMNDLAITATLLANTRLANALGVRGVPFYLVGDQVVAEEEGDFYAALTARVADIREHGCRAAC